MGRQPLQQFSTNIYCEVFQKGKEDYNSNKNIIPKMNMNEKIKV
jgi:hypothetical protein